MQVTKRGREDIPIRWLVFAIAIAVILSVIISLILINVSGVNARDYSLGSGTIIVEVLPESSDSGIINVNVKGG